MVYRITANRRVFRIRTFPVVQLIRKRQHSLFVCLRILLISPARFCPQILPLLMSGKGLGGGSTYEHSIGKLLGWLENLEDDRTDTDIDPREYR
jgi:hypothetical protein